jgi:hypothetical protein
MGPAFITGLPRSRTYWFAEYFSTCGVPAVHELLNGCSRQDFYTTMEKGIINSDCGLPITDFQERFPEAPCVIIHRELVDAHSALSKFCKEIGWRQPYIENLVALQDRLQSLKGLHVEYRDIDERLEEIHQYLTPNVPYCAELADQMCSRNLKVDPALYKLHLESYSKWAA